MKAEVYMKLVNETLLQYKNNMNSIDRIHLVTARWTFDN